MKRKLLIRILLASFAIGALAGSYLFIRGHPTAQADAAETAVQQAVARQGSLRVSVSGSGELAPASIVELGFEQGGELVELLVQAGDKVQAGDVLARLRVDKTSAEHAAEIAAAQLVIVQAGQALNQLYENAQMEAAQALLAVEQASRALEDLQHDEMERALAQQAAAEAQEAIQTAEMAQYIANSSASDDAIYTAYASLLFKEKLLAETEVQIARTQNQIKSAANDMIKRSLERQLMNLNVKVAEQRIDYQNALTRYNNLQQAADPLEVSLAQARLGTAQKQLAQAQVEWEQTLNGPTAGEIAAAQAALFEAEAAWERLKDGPDPDEIAQAEKQLEIARVRLVKVQAEKLILDLVAPIDGTLLSVDAAFGDRLAAGTFVTLADLSQLSLEVHLDETDLEMVRVGDEAEIVFDALPDEIFTGQVTQIDPSLVNLRNTYTGRTWVQPELSSYQSGMLLVGLNASVDIITGSIDEATLVPVEALRQDDSGGYAVYVLKDGAWLRRSVSVGLMDLTTAAIIDGLEGGEIVAIEDIRSNEGAQ